MSCLMNLISTAGTRTTSGNELATNAGERVVFGNKSNEDENNTSNCSMMRSSMYVSAGCGPGANMQMIGPCWPVQE